MKIPILPKSMGRGLTNVLSGPVVGIIWRVFLVLVFGILAFALAGAAVASSAGLAILVTAILSALVFAFLLPPVQDAIQDLWNREFYTISPSLSLPWRW